MRLSDKMTQTRHNIDKVYDSLGESITSALNEMFEYGAEAEQERIIKILETARNVYKPDTVSYDYVDGLIQVIKGER